MVVLSLCQGNQSLQDLQSSNDFLGELRWMLLIPVFIGDGVAFKAHTMVTVTYMNTNFAVITLLHLNISFHLALFQKYSCASPLTLLSSNVGA